MLHVSGMSIEINKWEHSNYESETSTALVLANAMQWGGVGWSLAGKICARHSEQGRQPNGIHTETTNHHLEHNKIIYTRKLNCIRDTFPKTSVKAGFHGQLGFQCVQAQHVPINR